MTRVDRGTVFCQALKVTEYVSIANCHEHTAGALPRDAKHGLEYSDPPGPPTRTPCARVSLPKESARNTKWTISGHHVLEDAATHRHETLSLDLSVQTLAGLHGQHHEDVFLC